jgi:hypothetical protein
MYITSVSHGCCKSRSRCCICYNDYTRMLQMSVLNFSFVIRRMLKGVYLDVAYVSRICWKRFIWMLHIFATVFKCYQVFCKCFKCMLQVFKLFQTYIASALSGCCVCFAMIFKCFHVFFKYFRRVFQVFYLSYFVSTL